jgi:poly-gamma-glutamate capsule biosynthesis protein CapA/YwtB (metallophosphatase superfamily)
MFPSFTANIVALQTLTHATLQAARLRNRDNKDTSFVSNQRNQDEAEIEMEVDEIINELEKEEQARINIMTVKSVKLQLERAQEENALLHQLVKELEAKIAIFENTIDKLGALNYIHEKYNIPGN